MKKIAVLLSVVLSGFCISSAVAADQSDAEFLKSYKKSFLDSCVESSGGDQYKSLCACVLSDVVGHFSVADLKSDKGVSEYIENVAMKKCEQ
ncbi:hypothetical protein [Ketobacter sp.]|uniref:hypothetical protein n=1 Tax=Ketobacter sp. TaxID=2083498 RepID=UPI000F13DB54|nr:hypothetical protein [Ketobacter sp.]RLT93485.1 MAG: hypothetical protein D9N14_18465 [Ketobacter sp.]